LAHRGSASHVQFIFDMQQLPHDTLNFALRAA